MADVFVSYARKNRPRVAEVSGALEASGYSLWWDRQIESGSDYGMLIEREIDAAGCVVVAWSDAARRSLWVRAEANEALDSGKLVQICLDETKLPLPFTMLHFLDFSGWRGERDCEPWTGLDSRVGAMLRGETLDSGAAPAAERPARAGPALQGLGRAAWLGWAAIALAAAMAVAILMTAAGSLSPAAFGSVTLIGLALAAILLALAAFTLVRVAAASR
jgi:TIR domain-containing protein